MVGSSFVSIRAIASGPGRFDAKGSRGLIVCSLRCLSPTQKQGLPFLSALPAVGRKSEASLFHVNA